MSDPLDILRHPHLFGNLIGFDLLRPVHSVWISRWLHVDRDWAHQAHRNGYKTSCIVVFIILSLLRDPELTILALRKDATSAARLINQVKDLLTTSEPVRYFFKELYGIDDLRTSRWSTRSLTLAIRKRCDSKEGNLDGGGIRIKTGNHYKLIIADDIVAMEDRYYKAFREATKMAVRELQNIKTPGGRILFVGTPWHKDDAWTEMPKPRKWALGSFHLPEFTPEHIAGLQRPMLRSLFAANYLLKHEADEALMFSKPQFGPAPKHARFTLALDPAYDGNCTTALVGLMHDATTGLYHAVGKAWDRNVADVYDDILDYAVEIGAEALEVERNADHGLSVKALSDLKSAREEKLRGLVKKNVNAVQARADLKKLSFLITGYDAHANKHARISVHVKRIWHYLRFDPRFEVRALAQVAEYSEDSKPDDVPDALARCAEILDPGEISQGYGGGSYT